MPEPSENVDEIQHVAVGTDLPDPFAEEDECSQQLGSAVRELGLLHELTDALHGSRSLQSGLEHVLQCICEGTGWTLGEVWLPTNGNDVLRLAADWIHPGLDSTSWDEASRDLELGPGDGLPGRAFARRETLWIDDLRSDSTLPRAETAGRSGLHAGVAIPIHDDQGAVGVLMFTLDEPRSMDRRFVRLVSTVAAQLASALRRRRAEQRLRERTRELERANRELERFVSTAAHDLQEPLRDVARYVQRIQQRLDGDVDETTAEDMTYVVDGAKRLHELLTEMLRYAEAGDHTNPQQHAADVDAALDEVLDDLSESIEATGAQVTRKALGPIPLGERELRQLLHALVKNAVTYHDGAPNVHVEMRTTEEAVVLTVEDDGPGIDPAYHEQAFELFERLDRKRASGAGVGLALCRRIVERHDGQILLASAPGQGTTVAVRLPAGRPP